MTTSRSDQPPLPVPPASSHRLEAVSHFAVFSPWTTQERKRNRNWTCMLRWIFITPFTLPSLFVVSHGPQTLLETEPASCERRPALISPSPLKTQSRKCFLHCSGAGVVLGHSPGSSPFCVEPCWGRPWPPEPLSAAPAVCLQRRREKPPVGQRWPPRPRPARVRSLPAAVWAPVAAMPLGPRVFM